jgi:hypothetical protein
MEIEETAKWVTRVTQNGVKMHLAIAGSRLREALEQLELLASDKAFRPGLEDHELLDLQDCQRRIEPVLKYVDEVFRAKDVVVCRATKKVKHT